MGVEQAREVGLPVLEVIAVVGEVLRVMRGLADEGRTMVVVTHEMGFAREVSSKAMFLHRGRVEEEGSPNEVFGNPKSERCRAFLASVL